MLLNNTTFREFCSLSGFYGWLQNHLIPCPFKYLTGIDCPGCGFQRAMIAFIQGDFSKSWGLYPPAIPLALFLIYGLLDKRLKLDNRDRIKKTAFMIVGSMVAVNYAVKMWLLFAAHYHVVSLAMMKL